MWSFTGFCNHFAPLIMHTRICDQTQSSKLTILSFSLKTARIFFGSGVFAMGRSGYRKRQYYFVPPNLLKGYWALGLWAYKGSPLSDFVGRYGTAFVTLLDEGPTSPSVLTFFFQSWFLWWCPSPLLYEGSRSSFSPQRPTMNGCKHDNMIIFEHTFYKVHPHVSLLRDWIN